MASLFNKNEKYMKKHYKNTNKKTIILSIIRIIFFIMLIISVIYITKWYIDNRQNKIIKEKISEVVIIENNVDVEPTYKIDFEKLKQTNK